MMVPRSYQFTSKRHSSATPNVQDEKAQLRPFLRQKSVNLPVMRPKRNAQDTPKSVPSSAASARTIEPVPSKPVVIPSPRSSSPSSPAITTTQSVRMKGHHGDRLGSSTESAHDSNAIPPAVAALLAVTSIPTRSPHMRKRRSVQNDRRISIDELVAEWRQDDKEGGSTTGYGSPLDILLERSEDVEDDASTIDAGSDKEGDFMPARSISSDSITSMPSLDGDERSLSSMSGPATPSFSRKEKLIASPPKEDCLLDHPLLHFSHNASVEEEESSSLPLPSPSKQKSSSKSRYNFKSNLTASLQALKSAAKSFSNFTAPSIPPDDLLTRSLLSPRFASEMRPKSFSGLPTPAMRRYLNPQQPASPTTNTYVLKPTEIFPDVVLAASSEFSSADHHVPTISSPMIQMQTYSSRGARSSSSRQRSSGSRATDPLSEAGRAMNASSSIRQREPRENSDFLRIIVMEMNMRREGKLDPKAMGRARVWLPPRQLDTLSVELVDDEDADADDEPVVSHRINPKRRKVPRRWVGVGVND
jgi:hypothetical protein